VTSAQRHACEIEHVPLASHRAPDGAELAVDLVWVQPQSLSKDWLIVVSGNHGIEGYVGSAVQSAWLEALAGGSLPDIGVLMIHALNPFGMAWWSRSDHLGIDVNRNFIAFDRPVINPGYARLHPHVCSSRLDSLSHAALSDLFAGFETTEGSQALTNALIGPQSTHPDGMNYTGVAPSWSRRVLEGALERLHARGAERMLLIDLHAGVAARGEIALLHFPAGPEDSDRGRRIWSDGRAGIRVGAQGLADYSGLLVQGARALIGSQMHAVVAEFGTTDRLKIREALRLDRWLRHEGDVLRDASVRERLIDVFCPRDSQWEANVMARGAELLAFAREGLLERWG
jgi:hypothetical protein